MSFLRLYDLETTVAFGKHRGKKIRDFLPDPNSYSKEADIRFEYMMWYMQKVSRFVLTPDALNEFMKHIEDGDSNPIIIQQQRRYEMYLKGKEMFKDLSSM